MAATIDKAFPTGAYSECRVHGKKGFALTIAPEDEGQINCSPWYAFRLTPARKGRVTIELDYERCGHRYWPKTSSDGVTWEFLPRKSVTIEGEGADRTARISLKLGDRPLFVAAQEIMPPSTYEAWLDSMASSPGTKRWLLGKSAEGRDIPAMTIAAPVGRQRETVVLVGRQHPPEVSGALAMVPFVEALLEDNELARAYRARFETVVVPILNPDGVMRGHWRHATGGLDLNRDWGMFTQPETKLMGDLLAEVDADPDRKLRFFLDFHSTQEDVVYTLSKDMETDPPGFTDSWLADYQSRLSGYKVKEEPGYSAGRGVAKNWVYDKYGVPTATFELGDETDRTLIGTLGAEAARAMMKTLLETPTP